MQTALESLLCAPDTALSHCCEKAKSWVTEAGIEEWEELREHRDELAQALSLRPLEVKRLHKALLNMPPHNQTSLNRTTVKAAAPLSQTTCKETRNEAVHVKNTFLTVREPANGADCNLRKLRSEPVAGCSALPRFSSRETSRGNSDLESTSSDEAADSRSLTRLVTQDSWQRTMTRTVTEEDGLCKIVTSTEADFPTYAPDSSWAESADPVLVDFCQNQEMAVPLAIPVFLPEMMPCAGWPLGVPMTSFEPASAQVMGDPSSELEEADVEEEERKPTLGESSALKTLVPMGLQTTFSVSSGSYQVTWTLDARRLKSTDREAVSPSFELSFGEAVPFRIVLHPRCQHDGKGGSCFKKSGGKGRVELRCLGSVEGLPQPVVTFNISVGSPGARGFQRPRGPVTHDFAECPLAGLPASQETWDFGRAVQKPAKIFQVCVEFSSGKMSDS